MEARGNSEKKEMLMDLSKNSSTYISTQTAALLAGKSVRTINNWLESGSITASGSMPSVAPVD
jgi:hypothetical protein